MGEGWAPGRPLRFITSARGRDGTENHGLLDGIIGLVADIF